MPYSQCYERQMLQYFTDCQGCDFPTFSEFARGIGATMAEMREWRRREPGFAAAWNECRERQKSSLIRGALARRYDAALTKFLLSEMFGQDDENPDGTFSVTVEVIE